LILPPINAPSATTQEKLIRTPALPAMIVGWLVFSSGGIRDYILATLSLRPPLRAVETRKYDKITRSPKKASDAPRVFVKILN
jgi:hypothetical protein